MFPPQLVGTVGEVSDKTFKKVRKRPIVVEAVQMDSDFQVQTLEGVMSGKAGDYLIRGIKGELYICAREVFDETYDVLD